MIVDGGEESRFSQPFANLVAQWLDFVCFAPNSRIRGVPIRINPSQEIESAVGQAPVHDMLAVDQVHQRFWSVTDQRRAHVGKTLSPKRHVSEQSRAENGNNGS